MRTEILCISVLRVATGPRVKLAGCKSALNPPVVCSTDRSKAVVPVLVLHFVALWFILRGDLLYVFPCVILSLCFSVLLVLRLPRLEKRELILVLFVRLFGLCLFRFVGFLFLLGSGKGCGLWLWHSLDFSLTLFVCFLFFLVSGKVCGLWLWHSLDFSLTFFFYFSIVILLMKKKTRCNINILQLNECVVVSPGGLLYWPFLGRSPGVLLFVALWLILRGVCFMSYLVLICSCVFSLFLALHLPRLGKRELILVLFVRLFDLCLFAFVGFLFLLVSRKGCGLWLWHSLDFFLTFFASYVWWLLFPL